MVLNVARESLRLLFYLIYHGSMTPLMIIDSPTPPECGGSAWAVANMDALAELVALVLIGRAAHAEAVLQGTMATLPATIARATKDRIISNLRHDAEGENWHRDAHLFEIICWVAARVSAAPGDVISPPHHSATQQGLDSLRVSFDDLARVLIQATVYEFKCTTSARTKFRDEVLKTFLAYNSGERDPELSQNALALLDRFNLTGEERIAIYDKLIRERPLAFSAALTVAPERFDQEMRLALFAGFTAVGAGVESRSGDTFALAEIRAWFSTFAELVVTKIEAMHV